MTEVVVGRPADFPDGTHRIVEVDGRRIGVFRIGGRFYALPNRCPHQGGPLCEGRGLMGTLVADEAGGWRPRWAMDGEVIACPWHGLEYHVPTGRCLAYPDIRLRHHEVMVRGDEIVVRVGSRAG